MLAVYKERKRQHANKRNKREPVLNIVQRHANSGNRRCRNWFGPRGLSFSHIDAQQQFINDRIDGGQVDKRDTGHHFCHLINRYHRLAAEKPPNSRSRLSQHGRFDRRCDINTGTRKRAST
jgi:hypothetical protein